MSRTEEIAAARDDDLVPAETDVVDAAPDPAPRPAGTGEAGPGGDREPAEAGSEPAAGEAGSEPDAVEPEPEAVAEGDADEAPAKVRPAWLRLPALLLAAALVLAGAGVWFTLEARSASGNPAADNLALTDVGATADVTSAVTLAMNRVFSYSYDKTDVTEKAGAAVLRGSAKDSYDKLFTQVREKAPQQKLVLTSRVSAIAVQDLRNGHARLLVFLDQSAVRADNNATDSAAAQLSVTAEHTGDGWVVTELEPR
jgi:Mce-associated membrane protein